MLMIVRHLRIVVIIEANPIKTRKSSCQEYLFQQIRTSSPFHIPYLKYYIHESVEDFQM